MTIQTDKRLLPSVATWAILQLALLGIGASGFPLWAHHPLPHESLSFEVLICGQVLLISILFPILTRSGWALTLNIALMLPFDEFAGLLSHTPIARIAEGGCCVAIWMVGLASLCRLLKDYRSCLLMTLGAMLFTGGGTVLDYLRWEASAASGDGNHFAPQSLLCRLCTEPNPTAITWLQSAAPMLLLLPVAITSTLLHHPRKSRSTAHNQTP